MNIKTCQYCPSYFEKEAAHANEKDIPLDTLYCSLSLDSLQGRFIGSCNFLPGFLQFGNYTFCQPLPVYFLIYCTISI